MAFIGFAGTDFNGRRAVLDETDEGERILLDWMGGQWTYRFSPISSQKKEVRSALTRLRDAEDKTGIEVFLGSHDGNPDT